MKGNTQEASLLLHSLQALDHESVLPAGHRVERAEKRKEDLYRQRPLLGELLRQEQRMVLLKAVGAKHPVQDAALPPRTGQPGDRSAEQAEAAWVHELGHGRSGEGEEEEEEEEEGGGDGDNERK